MYLFGLELDEWQKEVIEAKEQHLIIKSGRQVGKSKVVAIKALNYAKENENKTVLIISRALRQSGYLFDKIRRMAEFYCPEIIKDSSQTKLTLKNGSIIYSLPCGYTGASIRGYTIDLLILEIYGRKQAYI